MDKLFRIRDFCFFVIYVLKSKSELSFRTTNATQHTRKLFHHLLRLLKLLHEPVHFTDVHPCAFRNSALSGWISNIRIPAFFDRHRVDNGLNLRHLFLTLF